jgi:Fe-S cluster biogenesis protein NfuA
VDTDTISGALDSIRSGLQADGFDLYLREVTASGSVVVCLEAKPEACLDCLVPDQILQQIVATAVRGAEPGVTDVVLVKEGFDALGEH